MKIKAVIFDMDGIMVDTEKVAFELTMQVHEEAGYDLPEELLLSLIGTNEKTSLATLQEFFGPEYDGVAMREQVLARRKQYYQNNPVPIKPGLTDLIAFLKANKLKIAVASSSNKNIVEFNLKAINVYDDIDVIVAGDQVTHSKPSSDIFDQACAKLDVSNDQCFVIEDSENGIIAAKNAHIRSIWIKDLVEIGEEAMNSVYVQANDLSEIKAIITKNI